MTKIIRIHNVEPNTTTADEIEMVIRKLKRIGQIRILGGGVNSNDECITELIVESK
jgi:hypothetical protein